MRRALIPCISARHCNYRCAVCEYGQPCSVSISYLANIVLVSTRFYDRSGRTRGQPAERHRGQPCAQNRNTTRRAEKCIWLAGLVWSVLAGRGSRWARKRLSALVSLDYTKSALVSCAFACERRPDGRTIGWTHAGAAKPLPAHRTVPARFWCMYKI